MFPTLTAHEFEFVRKAVANLAQQWLNAPHALNPTAPASAQDLAEEMERRNRRIAAFRVQMDALGLINMTQITNIGQLQCITRFLAENIALA